MPQKAPMPIKTKDESTKDAKGGHKGEHQVAHQVAHVLLPLPLEETYSYRFEEKIEAGAFVRVPFGSREINGVLWEKPIAKGLKKKSAQEGSYRLKSILSVHDMPPLTKEHRAFLEWVARYTLAPLGAVLRLTLSSPTLLHNPKRRRAKTAEEEPLTRTPPPRLSARQEDAASFLKDALARQSFQAILLDGVTGAGKTEVYAEGIDVALHEGKQVLLLLPEIALTNHFLSRLRSRFGNSIHLWHSALTPAQRRITWRAIAEGAPALIVGARSALFLPFRKLGLIIVDEEHDPAYKQEDHVLYHARDMSVVRGFLDGFPVLLSSATPSLESLVNVKGGRYQHVTLPKRHGKALLPQIEALDLRSETRAPEQWIAPGLREALKETLERKEQALLFLNRRGYAPMTLCRACGHHFSCPNCTAWLVEHRAGGHLLCHHCDYRMKIIPSCPTCGAQDARTACGPGIERISEEIRTLFPKARTASLSRDLPKSAGERRAILEAMQERRLDILVGTQIIAKGLHFPYLTLSGVVDADLGLANGDLRAAERTYQLLQQVAGRAGRAAGRKGRAFLQTHMPDHPVMQALVGGAREAFLAAESQAREESGMPPFGRLAALIISGEVEKDARAMAREISAHAPQEKGVQILGPADAPLYRLRGRYRIRFLVKGKKDVPLQDYMRRWMALWRRSAKVRVVVDMDPQNFM